jgi:SAM-dependent methyltransferase
VILSLLANPALLRANFGGTPRFTKSAIKRATLRPVELAGGRRLQLSCFDGRKVLYSNHNAEELPTALAQILAAGFSNVHISTTTEGIDLRLTKKGDLLIGRTPATPRSPSAPRAVARDTAPAVTLAPVEPHNRPKDLPLPEGSANPLLSALGILDRNHRVRPTERDKFTQINEFLKLLQHALPDASTWHRHPADGSPPHPDATPLTILDCGCGSSHLTLATAYYLNHTLKIPARLLGIDANEEVIEKSRARAEKLNAESPQKLPIEFRTAKIGDLENLHADIVLALHACDTATDDALAQAVKSNAHLILAVPCCHKNLNSQLNIPSLAPIHHHGILHQRQADLITDAFRALLLKVLGYRAEVIEFISREHTARNLMIRALKAQPAGNAAALDEYRRFKKFAGVTPYLEAKLLPLCDPLARTPADFPPPTPKQQ